MTEAELLALYPRLFHMAEDGSWPSIQENGLLSTSALLDLYRVEGQERFALESRRRPESVVIRRNGYPDAIIRDQKPMSDSALEKCLLDGLTPQNWYETLNRKTFFWLSKERLWGLLRAKAYREQPQTVLTIDTAALVAAHRERVLLSPINSGSTIMNPQPRGGGTFVTVADYPYADRRRTRTRANALVELVVLDSVPDIRNHAIAAHRIENSQVAEIWRREGADPNDGPEL